MSTDTLIALIFRTGALGNVGIAMVRAAQTKGESETRRVWEKGELSMEVRLGL